MTSGPATHVPARGRHSLQSLIDTLDSQPLAAGTSSSGANDSKSRPSIHPVARALRVTVAIALIVGVLQLVSQNESFRALEAMLATLALSPFSENQIAASGFHYFVWTAPDYLVALRVTVECTALVFAVPLTIAAASVLALTRTPWVRVIAAIISMWVLVVLVNTLRLWVIGWATMTWGMDPGYTLSHTLVGSIIGILGFVAGVATLFIVMGFKRSKLKSPKRGS